MSNSQQNLRRDKSETEQVSINDYVSVRKHVKTESSEEESGENNKVRKFVAAFELGRTASRDGGDCDAIGEIQKQNRQQQHAADIAGNEEDTTGVQFRIKSSPAKTLGNGPNSNMRTIDQDEEVLHPDDLLDAKFEEFGTTPPRTRMKIKNRDWDRKQKAHAVASVGSSADVPCATPKKGSTRLARCRVLRRNTMDCAILNEMFVNEETKRTDKRAQAILRDAEREMKTSMAAVTTSSTAHYQTRLNSFNENSSSGIGNVAHLTESLDTCPPLSSELNVQMRTVPKLVESCNRYMSVSSRPIGCRQSAPPLAFMPQLRISGDSKRNMPGLNIRKEFHETFANLIKLGSVDRQDAKLSLEEHTFQTELKDLIWLELQAWQADRTLEQQDRYLFAARQSVPDLLTQIINYKFQPKYRKQISQISIDSGIISDASNASSPQPGKLCTGCLNLYCKDCSAQQEAALKEVEELLTRLEAAEALYPSSQAMGAFHPIYKSQSFVGRIKAMCLWYNITKQNQLKMCILGKILARLQGERFSWPVQTSFNANDSSSSASSVMDNDDSGVNSIDSLKTNGSAASSQRKCSATIAPCVPKVQFMLNDVSQDPSEASSSNESTSTEVSQFSEGQCLNFRKNSKHDINIFSVEPLGTCNEASAEQSSALYRKFIENVLKSRGLAKALAFLHKLHNVVLYKAHISLEKPGTEDYDFETQMMEEDVPRLEPDISREQIDELRRYGHWSPEANSISLPTYIPSFVFLSGIPLQFMHEFLRMRLETRPLKPNPLSLEQLMKELREGLTLALTHRERYQRHISTALVEHEVEYERYMGILDQYDATVRKVFELYLDYIDQLVLESAQENNQKSALEREWTFAKLISPMIKGTHTLAATKFCAIIRNLLRKISERLVSRAAELDVQIDGTTQNDETELKWTLLTICREMQNLFTVERERSVKVLFFAKTFCRDVESIDFHRDHYEPEDTVVSPQDYMCPGVREAFKLLQKDVLDVRNKLTKIIERVQARCSMANLVDLDDQDRLAVLSRTREILHQGFKFGFEYNKDVIRLFEQRIMFNKEDVNEVGLALGIIAFAKMWMLFVTERCERGRGMRPRWASQGLEFLILACDPQITRHLDEHQFEDLKKKMDCCISHVIGKISEPEKVARKKASPRTRKTSSPATSRSRTPTRTPMSAGVVMVNSSTSNTPLNSPQFNKFLHPQFSLKEEMLQQAVCGSSRDSPDFTSGRSGSLIVGENGVSAGDLRLIVPQSQPSTPGLSTASTDNGSQTCLALRQIRVRDSVNRLDMELEERLRERNLIGHVKALNSCDKIQIRARSVNFRWHRGIKIGQGRFGKVYTAVNNNTGELMAMKEIAIQPGETRALKNVAEELKILEGIKHKNLVRYYGIEVHREELLIFMELCAEGTLESLVELSGGLPEGLTRRFTSQLLSGVAELHKHQIVHRDIKTANIFLVDGSNNLKLGDFGSAVKIQAHTTVPGELQGYVGTQAYMAPEVFTKTNSDGHGRAADIWSVGCVVVEMSSGKRPWAQFDSNFQIMFKVGMGERPETPESLSQEGHDFVDHCLQHDPRLRMTAIELLEHNFCKYGRDEECTAEQLQEQVRRSFRRNTNTKLK